MSTTAQRSVRLVVAAILQDYTEVPVVTPGNWDTPTDNLPEIKLRATGNRKAAIARAGANYTTSVSLELQARVSAATAEDAQDAIEALCGKIEDAVLALPELWAQLQQVASVETSTFVTAAGRTHIGEAQMTLQCETFEVFDPFVVYADRFVHLQQMLLSLDTTNPYDPTGEYTGSLFPDSVKPAPRESGPDGRDEATALIDLT